MVWVPVTSLLYAWRSFSWSPRLSLSSTSILIQPLSQSLLHQSPPARMAPFRSGYVNSFAAFSPPLLFKYPAFPKPGQAATPLTPRLPPPLPLLGSALSSPSPQPESGFLLKCYPSSCSSQIRVLVLDGSQSTFPLHRWASGGPHR